MRLDAMRREAMAMARGELGWANAVAAGAPPLPGRLISSVSLAAALFGLRAGSSIKCLQEAASWLRYFPIFSYFTAN